jgi:hypothetical protein
MLSCLRLPVKCIRGDLLAWLAVLGRRQPDTAQCPVPPLASAGSIFPDCLRSHVPTFQRFTAPTLLQPPGKNTNLDILCPLRYLGRYMLMQQHHPHGISEFVSVYFRSACQLGIAYERISSLTLPCDSPRCRRQGTLHGVQSRGSPAKPRRSPAGHQYCSSATTIGAKYQRYNKLTPRPRGTSCYHRDAPEPPPCPSA